MDSQKPSFSTAMKVLLAAMLLPSVGAFLYFQILASPMYISETHFAVRSAATSVPDVGGLASMFMPAGGSVGADAMIVAEYIQSPDIMEEIDQELQLFSHFSSPDNDLFSRLAANATRDERLKYWHWVVKPSYDPESGIIALKVKAYEPAMAKQLAEAVLLKSEALVNTISQRSQIDAIALSMAEVKTAEIRVKKSQEALRDFRNRSGMLDPASTAGGLQNIISQLESEAVKVRAAIAEASTYMSQNAPSLVGLKNRLAALENQLVDEKKRLAGESQPGSLSSLAGEFEDLQTENEFAQRQLVAAMTSMEVARLKAEAKSRYVVAFQNPSLPDESLYPRPFLFAAYTLVGTVVLIGILSLIIAAVREHANF
jgi:capsular polysaccharide transport system permease protein